MEVGGRTSGYAALATCTATCPMMRAPSTGSSTRTGRSSRGSPDRHSAGTALPTRRSAVTYGFVIFHVIVIISQNFFYAVVISAMVRLSWRLLDVTTHTRAPQRSRTNPALDVAAARPNVDRVDLEALWSPILRQVRVDVGFPAVPNNGRVTP